MSKKKGRKPKFIESTKPLLKRVPASQHERLSNMVDKEIEPFKIKQ
jgi:hypothetical protein